MFVDATLYYWRNNPQSFGRIFDLSHLEGIDAYAEQLDYFIKNKKQRYVEIVLAEYTEMFFWCYNRMGENGLSFIQLRPYLEKMKLYVKCLKVTKSLSIKQLIKYFYLVYYKIPKLIKD